MQGPRGLRAARGMQQRARRRGRGGWTDGAWSVYSPPILPSPTPMDPGAREPAGGPALRALGVRPRLGLRATGRAQPFEEMPNCCPQRRPH